eukprot:6197124-Pleurochrysis_carterae.AAC.1
MDESQTDTFIDTRSSTLQQLPERLCPEEACQHLLAKSSFFRARVLAHPRRSHTATDRRMQAWKGCNLEMRSADAFLFRCSGRRRNATGVCVHAYCARAHSVDKRRQTCANSERLQDVQCARAHASCPKKGTVRA